jgi:hypothetical protein
MCRGEDNIKVTLNELGREDMEWFHTTQDGVLGRAFLDNS